MRESRRPLSGRKPSENPRTIHNTFYTTPDEAKRIDAVCDRLGISKSEFIRRAVEAALEAAEKEMGK